MKTCKTCLKELEATTEFFYTRKTKLDGLSNDCKECYSKVESQRYHSRELTKRPPKRDPSREQKEIWCVVHTDLAESACLLTGYKLSPTIDHILSKDLVLCDAYSKSEKTHRVHLSVDFDRFEQVKTNRLGKFGIEKNEDIVNILLHNFIKQ